MSTILNIDQTTKFIIYVDDTTLLVAADEANQLVSLANTVLDKIGVWTERNALKIYKNKTKAIIFRPIK